MNIFLSSKFAPEKLVLWDGFGSPVPRQPNHFHTQTDSGAYLQTGFLPIHAAASNYLFTPLYAIRVSPEFIRSSKCLLMAFIAESSPAQGQ